MSSDEQPTPTAWRTAERRLGALQLAEVLGSVSEACRRLGIDRGSFYAWQRRFRTGGIDALKPQRRAARPAPKAEGAARDILALALEHPDWGCARLAQALEQEGVHLSPPTVQSALRRLGIPRRRDRALRLEELARDGRVDLDDAQAAFVERFEPGFRERSRLPDGPGEWLLQTAFYFGLVEGRRAYVHCVLDAYSGFAFARLARGHGRAGVATRLLAEVVQDLRDQGLRPGVVHAPQSPAFAGEPDHPYAQLLEDLGLERVLCPSAHGQVERFQRLVAADLWGGAADLWGGAAGLRAGAGGPARRRDWAGLGAELDECVRRYNSQPLAGHPNYGASPLERLETSGETAPHSAAQGAVSVESRT